MDDKEKLAKLRDTVLEEAEKEAAELIEPAQRQNNEILKCEEEKLAAEVKEYILSNSVRIKSETGKKIAQVSIDGKKELLCEREKYIRIIFTDVENKLKAFTDSDKYDQYLKRIYMDVADTLGGITHLQAAPCDVDRMRAIAPNTEITGAKRIRIGGLIAENGNLMIDYTFDKKLQTEMDKFTSNSMFMIE